MTIYFDMNDTLNETVHNEFVSTISLLTMHHSTLLQLENVTTYNRSVELSAEPYAVSKEGVDYHLRKYSLPFLCLIGFIGNTLSATMFLGKSLRSCSCCIFLGVRSMTDNGFLATLLIVWLDFLDIRIFHSTGLCHIVVFLAYVCSFLSVWCVVCVTIENYVRICHPVFAKLYCTSRTALISICILTFASICIYNMPLWSNEIAEMYESYYCVTKKEYQNLQLVLTYIDTAMTLIIPLIIILSLMAVIMYRGVEASKRKLRLGHHRSKYRSAPSYGRVAGLLSAVSITFIFLHTPIHIFKLKVIIETLAGHYDFASRTDRTIGNIFQVMYYLNFSISLLVYYCCGTNFRRIFKEILCKKCFCVFSDCSEEVEEDRVSDAGTTELTIILEKTDNAP